MEDCVFDSIYSSFENGFDLIHIAKTNGNVYFQNSSFKMLSFFGNILSIENIQGNIDINLLQFLQNEVYSQILDVKDAVSIIINNTNCTFTNNKNGILYKKGGGVFRLYNVLFKTIVNIQISFGFSVKTCFGIKIIDDLKRNTSAFTNLFVFKYFFCIFYLDLDCNCELNLLQ